MVPVPGVPAFEANLPQAALQTVVAIAKVVRERCSGSFGEFSCPRSWTEAVPAQPAKTTSA